MKQPKGMGTWYRYQLWGCLLLDLYDKLVVWKPTEAIHRLCHWLNHSMGYFVVSNKDDISSERDFSAICILWELSSYSGTRIHSPTDLAGTSFTPTESVV